jgi:phosphoenolpyruvate carboxykinase (ATP)
MQGIVEGTISWTEDPDFGHEMAAAVPGVDDSEILPPRPLYTRQGRQDRHDAMVARLNRERREIPQLVPGLDESLVKSLGRLAVRPGTLSPAGAFRPWDTFRVRQSR